MVVNESRPRETTGVVKAAAAPRREGGYSG